MGERFDGFVMVEHEEADSVSWILMDGKVEGILSFEVN
jgi:hypothetical protein